MQQTVGSWRQALPTERQLAQAAQPPDPPRVAWRKQMRRRVLDEAWTLAAENGWDRVRVADLAQRAEVSRPSIYAEFGDRAGIGQALVHRESDRFLTGLADVLERHRTHVGLALQAGVGHALAEAERNPFIEAVLSAARGGTDALLPFLTSRPEPILTAARTLVCGWLGDVLPRVQEGRRAEAADLLVRLSISHMLLPLPEPGAAPARVARAACAVLGIKLQA
ncbi:TetR family transcriptional regulator [Streptomyces populi]|uniref:TetR family transcriptional regulator n=1 Tax=Streptomyces populi TaxID=2058924 RepID=A0A2I0SGR6_9ACTN|nr:TetR family transcriptional regulator [Streptomyces populi]PKT69126.1 TetR family transcriptional regulator [Streptomyces populi]